MKRIMGMALMICLLCVPAGAQTNLTGTWYFTEAEHQGECLSARELGLDMTLVLRADGAMAMESLGQKVKGTWELSGSTLKLMGDNGVPAEAVYADGRLVLVDGDVTMYLDPYPPDGVTSVRADVVPLDFYGAWKAAYADMGQGRVGIEALNRAMYLTIEEGKATLSNGDAENALEMTTELLSPALVLTRDRGDVVTVYLHNEGLLSMKGKDGTIFFQRAVDKAFRRRQVSQADFTGRWHTTHIQTETEYASVDSLHMSCSLRIEDENVLLTLGFSAEKPMEIPCTASLQADVLTIDDGAGAAAEVWKNMDDTLSLQLGENIMVMTKEN